MTNFKKYKIRRVNIENFATNDYGNSERSERTEYDSLYFEKDIDKRYSNESHFKLRLFPAQKPYKVNNALNAFAMFPSEPNVFHCQIKDKDKGYCRYKYDASKETSTVRNRNQALRTHLSKHNLVNNHDDVILHNMNDYLAYQLFEAINEFKERDAIKKQGKEKKAKVIDGN